MAHDETLGVPRVLHAIARLQAGAGARQRLPDHLAGRDLAGPATEHAGSGDGARVVWVSEWRTR